MPDNTIVWCRAISTVEPDSVTWTAKETVGAVGNLTVGAAALPGGGAGNILQTVGPDPNGTDQDDRVPITVTDNDGTDPLTTIEEWQTQVEFTDAAGNHTAEFPTSAPPTSLQDLEKLIGEKLGVENVLKLDLLDLPAAGAGAKTSGTATGDSTADNVLEDSTANFPSLAEANRPDVGNLLVNKTDNRHCTITLVSDHDAHVRAGLCNAVERVRRLRGRRERHQGPDRPARRRLLLGRRPLRVDRPLASRRSRRR